MIRPLNNNVLLKKENIETKTASGIIITTSEKQEENIATVVAIGNGKLVDGKRISIDLKIGDRVFYEKYSGQEIEYEKEKYILIEDEKVLAVIE